MLETYQCLQARSDITQLKKLDNNLIAMCTYMHGIKIFSYDECSVSTNISNENLNSLTTSVDFSKNGKLVAFSTKSSIFLMDIATKKIIKTIKTDNEIVVMLSFDETSKYIIAATKSGRVIQYRCDGSSSLGRFFSFELDKHNSDNKEAMSIVSFLAFHKNIMACGGKSGQLCVINIHSKANKIIIKNTLSSVNSICFLDNLSIVSGDSKGVLYFNSLKDGKLIKQLQTGFTKIKQIVLMPNHNYIMVSGDDEHISIYDVNKFKLLHNKYIKFDDKVSRIMLIDEDTLLVVLKNKDIRIVKLSNSLHLKSLILHNSLDKAYMLIEKDFTLRDTKEYKELEEKYQKVYKDGTRLAE